MNGLRTLEEADLEALATGAWVLGTGGGGNTYYSLLNLKNLYRQGRSVSVIDPADLDDGATVALVAQVGAPLIWQERITDPQIQVRAVRLMEEYAGCRFDALMAVEIGGGNGLQPFLAAALMGLPVVDADTMGRAFPEAQMNSFAMRGMRVYPMALADPRENEMVVTRAGSWKWMERLGRRVCMELGSTVATCKIPRSGREVRENAIPLTVSQAIRIGRVLADAREHHTDPVGALLDSEGGVLLFTGKVVDLARRTTGGFLRGTAVLAGLDRFVGSRMDLDFQNEWSIARLDGKPRAMVPDLICILESESGEAIGTETLRYGQRASVIALPAPALLLTPEGLECVGPRAFGYDMDFVSVFSEEPG